MEQFGAMTVSGKIGPFGKSACVSELVVALGLHGMHSSTTVSLRVAAAVASRRPSAGVVEVVSTFVLRGAASIRIVRAMLPIVSVADSRLKKDGCIG